MAFTCWTNTIIPALLVHRRLCCTYARTFNKQGRMQLFAMIRVIALAFCSLLFISAAQPVPTCSSASSSLASQLQVAAAQAPSCTQLADAVVLRWGIKGDVITFGLQAQLPPSTAYVGIGLSELGSMKGADIALFNSTSSGKWTLVDAYATGFVKPAPDQQQNVKLLGVQFNNGSFLAAWQRRLSPCDKQDLPIKSTPTYIIWGYGSSWAYHGSNRGQKLVSLLDSEQQQVRAPQVSATAGPANRVANKDAAASTGNTTGLKVLDLVYPVTIPSKTTTYFVHYFKLPSDKKYHILKYEPIGNSSLLHHGVMYSCNAASAAKVAALPSMGPFNRMDPKFNMLCEQFYMLVTPNTSYTSPPNVGLPMGLPTSSYVALELHYNNPEHLTGLQDASGLRVYYTDKLLPHDMGLITLQQPQLVIPPGQEAFVTNVSVCPASCTARFKGPITLLDSLFHMHGTGKSIITRHYRNTTELAPIAQLRAFDYPFQGFTAIAPESRTLRPGDALTLQCTFDTTARSNVTLGGLGTDDEMCFHWITYYPAQDDMGLCFTSGDMPVAVCGASYPPEARLINSTNAETMMMQLMQKGVFLYAPNPALNSTPYKEVCNPSTVV